MTNQRTMEVLRDLGIEKDVITQATPQHLMGNTVFCTALAGEELGRLRSWGNEPLVQVAHEPASPTRMCDMPQHLMEPVLVKAAISCESHLGFDTEYLSHEQDADGVTAMVRVRLRGDTYTIRAKYRLGTCATTPGRSSSCCRTSWVCRCSSRRSTTTRPPPRPTRRSSAPST
jgi:2,4-dichlorophenol 6-monooxygenase